MMWHFPYIWNDNDDDTWLSNDDDHDGDVSFPNSHRRYNFAILDKSKDRLFNKPHHEFGPQNFTILDKSKASRLISKPHHALDPQNFGILDKSKARQAYQ